MGKRNWLGPDAAVTLTEVLQSMADTIMQVDLSENKLEALGMRRLVQDLPALPVMRCLNVSQTLFATEAFAGTPFARLAEACPLLEELNLTSYRVGFDTASLETVMSAL